MRCSLTVARGAALLVLQAALVAARPSLAVAQSRSAPPARTAVAPAKTPAKAPTTASAATQPDSASSRGIASALSELLKPRLIGPAVTGGRISSVAVHPDNPGIMYVGVASGGVFKTDNGGATWTLIIDRQTSYSVGRVVVDPRNPSTVWVGTGENNSQRKVANGDVVYRSDDAGKSESAWGSTSQSASRASAEARAASSPTYRFASRSMLHNHFRDKRQE